MKPSPLKYTLFILPVIWFLLLLYFCGQTDFYYLKSAQGAGHQIAALTKAIEYFAKDMGRYPTTQEGLDSLLSKPTHLGDNWKGPYLTQEDLNTYFQGHTKIKDVWNSPYVYYSPAQYETGALYEVYSWGKNQQDNFGQKDDITNWRGADMNYYRDEITLNRPDPFWDRIGVILLVLIPIILIALIVLNNMNRSG